MTCEAQRSNDRESHREVIVGSHTGMGRFDATDTVHDDCSQGFLEIEYAKVRSREDCGIDHLCLDREPVQTIDTVGFDIASLKDSQRLIFT
jgi:hypothetical protein|tara:strand:- start:129 stop:401 length:273 start_codon:yes stop_codon:yes gene_type:complete